jgi:hypothetical protein
MKQDKLSRIIFKIKAESFLAYGEVLLQTFFFLLFQSSIVDYFKVVRIDLVVL